jgi:hypothetical protein
MLFLNIASFISLGSSLLLVLAGWFSNNMLFVILGAVFLCLYLSIDDRIEERKEKTERILRALSR